MLRHYIGCQLVDSHMTCQTPNIDNTPSGLKLQARSTSNPISSSPIYYPLSQDPLTHVTSLISCFNICLISALSQSHTPLKFSPNTASKFCELVSAMAAGPSGPAPIPAALKQTSNLPNSFTVSEIAASMASSELQSHPNFRT